MGGETEGSEQEIAGAHEERRRLQVRGDLAERRRRCRLPVRRGGSESHRINEWYQVPWQNVGSRLLGKAEQGVRRLSRRDRARPFHFVKLTFGGCSTNSDSREPELILKK